MQYTMVIILSVISVIAIYGISQMPWLFRTKSLLNSIIIASLSFYIVYTIIKSNLVYGTIGIKNIAMSAFFCIGVFSGICGSVLALVQGIGYFFDVEKAYTEHYMYQPIQIIKDTDEVRVIGKTQILRSSKVSDYTSSDLKICKDEQYSAAKIRLKDKVYICR